MSIRPIGTHQHQGKCSHLDNYKQIRKSVLVKHAFKGHLFTKSTFVSPPLFPKKVRSVFFSSHFNKSASQSRHKLSANDQQNLWTAPPYYTYMRSCSKLTRARIKDVLSRSWASPSPKLVQGSFWHSQFAIGLICKGQHYMLFKAWSTHAAIWAW